MGGALETESAGGQGHQVGGVALCGPLSVSLGGRRLEREFPGRQGRIIFAYLASRYPESVRREELLELLWPGETTDSSRNALNAILSKLKRALEPATLQGRDPLRLVLPEGAQIDLDVARDGIEAAEADLAAGRAADALEAARAALGTAERGFLNGLEGGWIEERRREVAELRLRALECAAGAALALGEERLPDAERYARELVEAAPFRESAHRLLMEALARTGDRDGALYAYRELEARLAEELGAEPAQETRELRDRLAGTGDRAASEPAAAALPVVLERADSGAFVGRERALGELEAAWERTLEGGVRLVALAGEPGIGKTRVAARFARGRHDAGALVLYGRCDEQGAAPFDPFPQALATVAAGEDVVALGPLAQELFRILPDRAGVADALPGSADGGDRFRLFTAVEELLAARARSQPLLLVLDDLHWAQRPTLALLRHLVRSAFPAPLLVLATYRDVETAPGEPLPALMADLRREGLADRIHLEGLSDESIRELLGADLGVEPQPLAISRLRERTGGNAFFIRELVRAVREAGMVDPAAGLEGLAAPEGVKALIARRLQDMPPDVAAVLGCAAVLGREADLRVLEQLPELASFDVLGALETALASGLATEVPGAPGRFAFTHALVRDALYETLTAARRARLHAQAADALEAAGAPPAGVARHLLAGGADVPAERTIAMLRHAGGRARSQAAYEEAARHFDAALALAERLDRPPAELCDLLLAAGEARQCAGEVPEARGDFTRAAAIARAADDATRLAAAALGMHGPYVETGVVDAEAIALLEEALEALGDGSDGLRVLVQAALARALYWTGDVVRLHALSAEALAAAEAAGHPGILAAALDARHEVLRHPRFTHERLGLVADVLARANELGDRALAAQAHQIRAVDLLELAERDAAERDFAAVARLARELRQPLFERYVSMWEVMKAQMEGRLEDAERLAHDTLAVALRSGARDAAQGFGVQLFAVLRYRGGVDGMRPMVQAIADEYPHLRVWRSGLALVCAEGGDLEGAATHFEALAGDDFASVPEDSFWIVAMSLAAEVCHELRDARAARVLLNALEPFGDRVVLARGAISFGPAARPIGLLHATLGDVPAADEWLLQSERISRRLRGRTFEVHARIDRARIHAAAGLPDAHELLTEARESAERYGLHRLVQLADAAA